MAEVGGTGTSGRKGGSGGGRGWGRGGVKEKRRICRRRRVGTEYMVYTVVH